MDQGNEVYACFLKFSKVFDKIDHHELIQKLPKTGANPHPQQSIASGCCWWIPLNTVCNICCTTRAGKLTNFQQSLLITCLKPSTQTALLFSTDWITKDTCGKIWNVKKIRRETGLWSSTHLNVNSSDSAANDREEQSTTSVYMV